MIAALVWLQATTFVSLGTVLVASGNLRRGLAQFCLAVVTALVYL